MEYWKKYKKHVKELIFERGKIYDNTIYTFDIESTSVLFFNDKILPTEKYNTLTEKEKKNCKVYGFMYIWQFSINNRVYFGRTWQEFKQFLNRVFSDKHIISYIYVHNLSYEMQFLRGVLDIEKVFARQKYKPIYFKSDNLIFRCSYYLTQAKLEKLPELYNLSVKKQVGNLDYKKIRHNKTVLTKEEMEYCENDCLVLYQCILKFKKEYRNIKNIPLTKTGILRRTTKKEMSKSVSFRCKMRDLNNTDTKLFNLETRAFSGGYVHANRFYSGEMLENVDFFDLCSSYPFVMCAEKVFPQKAFMRAKHTTLENLKNNFVYLINVKLKNIESKKENTILSLSKCKNVSKNHILDNGRILSADSIECFLTNYDYEMIKNFYNFEYELLDLWYSPRGYMPKDYIKFVLSIYKKKTKLKGVEGKEEEYARAKADFNSLYGLTVTNTIRDEITYKKGLWGIEELTDDDIKEKLEKESKKEFLDFSYGIFITSKARYNILSLVCELDKFNAYTDTDSLKLTQGYNKNVIYNYNLNVLKTIEQAKKELKLTGYTQKDIKGITHTLGILEADKPKTADKFITYGSKKYAYEHDKKIYITVAGVPKKGAKCLKNIEDFTNDFTFKSEITGKLQLFYNEEKNIEITITDYNGVTELIKFDYGIGLAPCDYKLNESSFLIPDYDMFIQRRIFKNP